MEWPDQSFDVIEESVISAGEEVETSEVWSADPESANSETLYECGMCWYTTYKNYNFQRHCKRHQEKKDNGNILGSNKDAPCTDTPTKKQAKLKTKICDQCGKCFKSSFALSLHLRNKHIKDFKYACDACGKGYNQKVQFNFHLASHLKFSVAKCCFCSKTFQGHSSLGRHKLTCSSNPEKKVTYDNNNFDCDVCCKTFKTKDRLNYHKKGMHGPKNYICPQCGHAYSWRSCLRKHRLKCK